MAGIQKKGALDMHNMPNWERFMEEVRERYVIKSSSKEHGIRKGVSKVDIPDRSFR